MDHQQISSPIQPIYSNMVSHSRFYHHEEESAFDDAKASSSSTRSPTTVYSVDELSSVFRVPDDAIERSSIMMDPSSTLGKESCSTMSSTGIGRRQRSLTPSLTTDGELSTFSEESEETDDDDDIVFRLAIRRRRSSPLNSIFRPVSGTKRRCEFEDSDEDACSSPAAKRSCSAPLLCRAGPIGSDSGSDDFDESSSSFLASSSFNSPFKGICRSSTISSDTTSSFTSLFANEAQPAIIGPKRASDSTVSIMPAVQLQHPLSFDTVPALKLKASNFIIRSNASDQHLDTRAEEERCDKES